MILATLPYFVRKLLRTANFGDGGGGDGGGDGSGGGDGTGGDGTGGFGGDTGGSTGGIGGSIGDTGGTADASGTGGADAPGGGGTGPGAATGAATSSDAGAPGGGAPGGGLAGITGATGLGAPTADAPLGDLSASLSTTNAFAGTPGLGGQLASELGFGLPATATTAQPGFNEFAFGLPDVNPSPTDPTAPTAPTATVTAQDLADLTGWMSVDQAGAFISPSGVVDWGAFNQAVSDFEQQAQQTAQQSPTTPSPTAPNADFFGPGGFNPNDPAQPPGSLNLNNISIGGPPQDTTGGLGVSGAGGGSILMPGGGDFGSLGLGASAPPSLGPPGLPGLEGGVELADGTVVPEPGGVVPGTTNIAIGDITGGTGPFPVTPPESTLTADQIQQLFSQLQSQGIQVPPETLFQILAQLGLSASNVTGQGNPNPPPFSQLFPNGFPTTTPSGIPIGGPTATPTPNPLTQFSE